MNYRHAFHAGNFADLVKHAALTRLLARLMADPSPLTVVDTHAGAGLYDLTDARQARSKEAEAGVARLIGHQLPAEFDGLVAAVQARNPQGGVETYPGSPSLILDALRPQDRYLACELRPDDHGHLRTLLKRSGKPAQARLTDGFAAAVEMAQEAEGRLFVLIDPPFERADDYVRIAETLGAVLKAKPRAVVLVWLPLKDLETLDGFVRRLEALNPPRTLIAEARLKPLHDPMKMNGCVLTLTGAPRGFEAELSSICEAVVSGLGTVGGKPKVWSVGR